MITVTAGARSLRAEGHAGSAPYGRDLVCAAVSALIGTLAAYLAELAADGRLTGTRSVLASGAAELSYDGESAAAAAALELTLTGLRILAAQYPECVAVDS